jgi:hypothetical protein
MQPDEAFLLVADDACVFAFSPDMTLAWKRDWLAGTYIEIEGCKPGSLTVSVQGNLDEPWRLVKLRIHDGTLE